MSGQEFGVAGSVGVQRFRSLLFTPATRVDRASHLVAARPDVIILDLEDAVPAGGKVAARDSCAELVAALARSAPGLVVHVRVNPIGGPWAEDDLALVLGLSAVDGVVVPKAKPGDEDVLADVLVKRPDLKFVAGIETALGVDRVGATLGGFAWSAAYFGAEDYVTDLGGRRTVAGLEVLYARSRVALAARVAGVAAIDQVVTAYRDAEVFRADAAMGRDLGYAGKLCIHPAQVELAHEAFTASAAEVAEAQSLLDSVKASGGDIGGAAVGIGGQMVDAPMIKRALDLLGRAPSDA